MTCLQDLQNKVSMSSSDIILYLFIPLHFQSSRLSNFLYVTIETPSFFVFHLHTSVLEL